MRRVGKSELKDIIVSGVYIPGGGYVPFHENSEERLVWFESDEIVWWLEANDRWPSNGLLLTVTTPDDPDHIFEVDCRKDHFQWGDQNYHRARAELNGEKLKYCVAADSKAGLALVVDADENGRPKTIGNIEDAIGANKGKERRMQYKLLRGEVRIYEKNSAPAEDARSDPS